MKKPDRKAFAREFGPRGAAKYAKAMQKYRKFLKTKPTAPPPAPKKKSPPAPPPAPKKKSPPAPPPAPKKAKPVAKKPAAKPKQNTGSFFAGAKGGKLDNKQRASERFFAGAKGGKYDKKEPSKPQKRRKNRRGSGMRIRDYRLF